MIAQVLKWFVSASDIMEAVKGCFYYYGMNAIYLITIPVEYHIAPVLLTKNGPLKVW